MSSTRVHTPRHHIHLAASLALLAVAPVVATRFASAQSTLATGQARLYPGNLVLSRSLYDNNPDNIHVGTILPPDCNLTQIPCLSGTGAPYNGAYPFVWNNDLYDANFGITSRILLDQISPLGALINTIEVPNSSIPSLSTSSDQLVTSFSSKSELGLHLSLDRRYLTFMGYVAPVDSIDISNSNTPDAVDPTNPVGLKAYRAIARLAANGRFTFTETNAYSGNNGRSAILNDRGGLDIFYTSGNAGNGANPQPNGVILGAGAQFIPASNQPEYLQNPGLPTPAASFSVTELGDKADKIGKDDNFRGIAVFNNVLYYTKGSGGNGVNTVYFVDTTGKACPNGVGLPAPDAALPTAPLVYDPANLQTTGLPNNMCILAGFPTALAKSANPLSFPFGIFFASKTVLYVADEGDGYTGGTDLYTHAAAQMSSGLQKWVLNTSTNTWNLAYNLQTGLDLGTPYAIANYPTGNNPATNLPWEPATDGLRNITGYRLGNRVLIWGITSTVSGNGDVGADPNRLVLIEDSLSNADPAVAASESFSTLRQARFAEVLRGISFTPDTILSDSDR